MADGGVKEKKETVDHTRTGFGWKTVLLNCSCHSFDQVEGQLVKAIKCSIGQARQFSHQVHTQGSAIVFTGSPEECENVAMILEDIQLNVKVVQ